MTPRSFISWNTSIGTRHLYWILTGPSLEVYGTVENCLLPNKCAKMYWTQESRWEKSQGYTSTFMGWLVVFVICNCIQSVYKIYIYGDTWIGLYQREERMEVGRGKGGGQCPGGVGGMDWLASTTSSHKGARIREYTGSVIGGGGGGVPATQGSSGPSVYCRKPCVRSLYNYVAS